MNSTMIAFSLGVLIATIILFAIAWISDVAGRLKAAKEATAPIPVPLGCCSDCRWAHRVSGSGWKRMCREAPEWKLVNSDHGCSRYEDEPIEEDSAP